MKILMLTPYLPYPLMSGGQIRSYNLLKNLSQKHEITLFSFIRKDEEKKYLPELQKFCTKIEVFKRRPAWSIKNIILAGFTLYPFLVSIYLSFKLRKAIKKELEKEKYDLIHAETFYVMPNIPKTSVPILLVEQTIEYIVYQHFVENIKIPPLKWLLKIDVAKIKYWEKHYWEKAHMVIAMSQSDKKIMHALSPNLKIEIVPNGVDFNFFNKSKEKAGERPTILFVGNFKWLQNREAVATLIKEVWPKIISKIPQIKLWIVGQNPTSEITSLATDNIIIDQSVKDIRVAYLNSDVLLAPIHGSGGTRFKILEAMASGIPVVTTSIGIEGIDAENEKEVLIRDNSEKMADSVVKLLKDRFYYQDLTTRARNLVKENYNWENIGEKLDKIYKEVGSGS